VPDVASLVQERYGDGGYGVKFEVNELLTGVYSYRLSASSGPGQAGNFIQVRKMLLS